MDSIQVNTADLGLKSLTHSNMVCCCNAVLMLLLQMMRCKDAAMMLARCHSAASTVSSCNAKP
jgi:hypothetical protein